MQNKFPSNVSVIDNKTFQFHLGTALLLWSNPHISAFFQCITTIKVMQKYRIVSNAISKLVAQQCFTFKKTLYLHLSTVTLLQSKAQHLRIVKVLSNKQS